MCDSVRMTRTRHFTALALVVGLLAGGTAAHRFDHHTPHNCDAIVAELTATHDYTRAMRPCLGEEDDPRVAAVLADHGTYYRTEADR